MAIRKRFGLPALAALLVSALLSGCGNSSSSSTVPLTTTVFYSHTVAFRNSTSQTLFGTGYNGFGQLGVGDLKNRSVATPVSGLGPVKKSAMGADHTVAMFDNMSTVVAWGSNNHGQIGNAVSNSGSTAFSSTPVKVHLNLPHTTDVVTDIAAGGFHSLAVVGGQVRSWGYNGFGQLGDGTLTDRTQGTPVLDTSKAPLPGIKSVAGGGEHSLALTPDGRVYAWGNNDNGQLAVTVTTPNYRPLADLVQVEGTALTNVIQIAAGANFSVALVDDGLQAPYIMVWGYNGGGQLGLDPSGTSATLFSATPTKITIPPAFLADGVTVTKVSAGSDHVLALLSDGSVVAWGLNNNAQLGLGTDAGNDPLVKGFSFTPAKVVGIDGIAIDIIAFGNQSLALVASATRNGSPAHWYGWGDNGFGQLGNSVSTNAIGYRKVPTQVQF